MPYKFLEDVTHADTAFEATGKTLKDLFKSAAQAVIETMANPKTVKKIKKIEFEANGKDIERLLFNFLEEIVVIKDQESMVFSDINFDLNEKKLTAKGTLNGESINPKAQELHQDVKAVTMHYFKVEKQDGIWKAQVVLDI